MSNSPGEKEVSSSVKRERRRSGKKVVRGRRQPLWQTDKISKEEMAALQRYFPEVVVVPEDVMEEARREWEFRSLFAKSLGGRVPITRITKEFKEKGKLLNEVEAFEMAEDHYAFRFGTEVECNTILTWGPWVICGQLLAVVPWVPCFVPDEYAIKSAMLWMRLPKLPMECWKKSTILSIASTAGQPMFVDKFTDQLRRLDHARVCVKVDITSPLKRGRSIQGENGVFWQRFVYENVMLCFQCDRIGHLRRECTFPALDSSSDDDALQLHYDGTEQ